MKNLCRLVAVLVALGVVLGPAALPAIAQSQSDLRRENARLLSEVNDLQRELEALRAELQRLREENDQLRRQLAAAPTAPAGTTTTQSPPPAPPVSIDETVPYASPRALLRALAASYAEAMTDLPIGDSPASGERTAYMRALDRWTSRVNREHKNAIEWHVEVVRLPVVAGRGYTVRLQAVDPVTSTVLGDPFDASLSRTVANRLLQIERRDGLANALVLRGVLVPRIHLNEDRSEPGPFDNPRFIGPFSEFDFVVDVQTLLPLAVADCQNPGGPAF